MHITKITGHQPEGELLTTTREHVALQDVSLRVQGALHEVLQAQSITPRHNTVPRDAASRLARDGNPIAAQIGRLIGEARETARQRQCLGLL